MFNARFQILAVDLYFGLFGQVVSPLLFGDVETFHGCGITF